MVSSKQALAADNDVLVYLVDDDRGMVSATSQWLSLSGLKVRAFADPTALVKVLKPTQPCVVISDIRMPGIDGLELMKLIHARDRMIPVILITGHGDIPLAVEAMKLGAFEFIQKPFSPEKLLEVVITAKARFAARPDEVQTSGSVAKKTSPKSSSPASETQDLTSQVDAFEKGLIEASLDRHKGSILEVIEELNIPRRTLNAKMKKHGIERNRFRPD